MIKDYISVGWKLEESELRQIILNILKEEPFYKNYLVNKRPVVRNYSYLGRKSSGKTIFETFDFRIKTVIFPETIPMEKDYSPAYYREILELYPNDYPGGFESFYSDYNRVRLKLRKLFLSVEEENEYYYYNSYLFINELLNALGDQFKGYQCSDLNLYIPSINCTISVAPTEDLKQIGQVKLIEANTIIAYMKNNENGENKEIISKIIEIARAVELENIFSSVIENEHSPVFFEAIYGDSISDALAEIKRILPEQDPMEVYYNHIPLDFTIDSNDPNKQVTWRQYFMSGQWKFHFIKSKFGYFYSIDQKTLSHSESLDYIKDLVLLPEASAKHKRNSATKKSLEKTIKRGYAAILRGVLKARK